MSSKRRVTRGSAGGSDNLTLNDRFSALKSSRPGSSPAEGASTKRRVATGQRQSDRRFASLMTQRTGQRVAPARRGRGGPASRGSSRGRGGGSGGRGRGAAGSGRGGRGGRGSRGGRGGRGRNARPDGKTPLTKEALDAELEAFMFTNEETAKKMLDNELDEYMQNKDNATVQQQQEEDASTSSSSSSDKNNKPQPNVA